MHILEVCTESAPTPTRSARYPDRLPCIVERALNRGASVPQLDKSKFLVPADLTVGQLVFVIRRRLTLPPEQALFLYVNATLPSSTLLCVVARGCAGVGAWGVYRGGRGGGPPRPTAVPRTRLRGCAQTP